MPVPSADLHYALNVATDLAVQGGMLIRDDFHRAGGPRGSGDHADVDDEVERLIRAGLEAAFPGWAYLGEETGSGGPADAPARWLVDPNDGTRFFLRGYRGSAISIALVCDGLPVLGVVYSPTAPDSAGDLITWAEGLLLTRNGTPVAETALPARLTAAELALVGQAAERSPLANLRCAAPARILPSPSIAYRLALVATGDGAAAISLNGPGDWDFGGGHALLRAAGGDLLNETGRPLRYHEPRTVSRWCFGGHPEVAAELAGRDWSRAKEAEPAEPLSALLPTARPQPGRAVHDAGLLRRAQGCLLGQAAGDALGSLVEFRSGADIRRAFPHGVNELADGGTFNTIAGQPTDDSEMALALARALLRDGHPEPASALAAYRSWRDSGPFDIGTTTSAGLAGRPNRESQANGSLMRISPLGIWGHALAADVLSEHARADSRLTHPHPICADACAAYTVAIAHAVNTGDGPGGVYDAVLRWAREARAEPAIIAALEAAAERPPADFVTNMGWVVTALQNAFYQLLHAPSLEDGIVATVMSGGDTDTTAAIAGALLGAVHGRDAVPARWRRAVLSCRPIRGLPGVHRPRPRPFWPVDLNELAEGLLLAGIESAAR